MNNVILNDQLAKLIVEELIEDISDRRGLKHEWEQIDDDIQQEIKSEWSKIILRQNK